VERQARKNQLTGTIPIVNASSVVCDVRDILDQSEASWVCVQEGGSIVGTLDLAAITDAAGHLTLAQLCASTDDRATLRWVA